jgi:hypothetical protein
VKGSERRWKSWVDSGKRNLKDIQSSRLRSVIERCLDPSPDQRPDALEFLNVVTEELGTTHGLHVAETLELWRRPIFSSDNSTSLNEHAAWASAQAQNLGGKQAQVALDKIQNKLDSLSVVDFESLEAWVPIAETVIQSTSENSDEHTRIRALASEYLVAILAPLDKLALKQIPSRNDLVVGKFERFSELIGRVAKIAEITAPHDPELIQQLGPYAKSALYFDCAGTRRSLHDLKGALEMLSSAIAEAPHEPTNYYFQAFWTYASLITELSRPSLDTVEEILKNLDMAIKLAPDWKEPQRLKRELVADCALIGRA